DISLLSEMVRRAYRDVAERFELTAENCPKHPSNCTEEWIRADFERGVRYFILEYRDKPAGCAAIEHANPGTCYLERLSVPPEYRRKGFGKALVEHVLREAAALGAQNAGIGVIAKQTDLKTWYEKIGFIEGETRQFEHLPFQVAFMNCALPGPAKGV
ncbi:MAG: GNAT family N-acetyltransferase, partial [Desulfobacterales bacterium]|nr:GNAT family N-acetyltransferase [Desulfobacterales bacterium]